MTLRHRASTEIRALFGSAGGALYFGENVTQLEHALQTAMLAQSSGADSELILAALVHDVGHLLHLQGEAAADAGCDTQHELLGASWLNGIVNPRVCSIVRLHVEAKRYLCAIDADYWEGLSEASRKSLNLQGGAMTMSEVERFRLLTYALDAINIRRWDDKAKVVGLHTPPLEYFLSVCSSAMVG